MARAEEPRPWPVIVADAMFRIRPWPRPDDRPARVVEETLAGRARFTRGRRSGPGSGDRDPEV